MNMFEPLTVSLGAVLCAFTIKLDAFGTRSFPVKIPPLEQMIRPDAVVTDIFVYRLSQTQQERSPWGDPQGTVVRTEMEGKSVAMVDELG
jgi:hypothetical protein